MSQNPTSRELQTGDNPQSLADSIAALYIEWRVPLCRYAAFKTGGSKAELEDLVQDVFVKLYVHVRSGSTIVNPKAWLFTAIRNRIIDEFRRARLMSSHLASVPVAEGEERGVEQKLERTEILELALSQLNVLEREILALQCVGSGLTYDDIAKTLNISAKSVSLHKSRALKKLRNLKP